MPEGYQDHRGVTVSPSVTLHRLDQPLDLPLGEMLPRSIFGVGFAPGQSGWRRLHCALFVVWSHQSQVHGGGHFYHLRLALLWQIFGGTGFPNQFFNDSWVVGFWRADNGRHNVELGRRASRMAQAVLGSPGP